jgi:hypothetical protein
MARLHVHALALAAAIAPLGCGKVTDPDATKVDAISIDAFVPPDAEHLSKPVASITTQGIAGTTLQCVASTPATGAGTVEQIASWQINGEPFTTATTTAIAGDTIPLLTVHTNDVAQCTLFATNGTETTASDPVSTDPFKPRLAYAIEQGSNELETIDLDSFATTPIGKLDVNFAFGDIAWDATNQKLYMVDGEGGNGSNSNALYTIDVTTGKTTLIGVHGVPDLGALSFDGSGQLYAGSFLGNELRLVNTTSSLMTTIGTTSFSSDGFAFDTKRQLMMTMVGGAGQMSTLDLSTGVPTQVSADGGLNDFGMTYDPFVDRLEVIDFNGSTFRYDPNNNYTRQQLQTLTNQRICGLAMILPPPQ